MVTPAQAKSGVLAVSTVVVVITGAWLGADLKLSSGRKKVSYYPSTKREAFLAILLQR